MTDIAEGLSTTAVMSVGGEFVGRFESLNDNDWIAIQLVAGITYSLNLGAATSSSGSFFDTILDLYDASGALLASNDVAGATYMVNPVVGERVLASSYMQFTPTTTGTYYMSASYFEGAGTGEYLLSVYEEDLRDTPDTSAELQLGSSVTGQITDGDHDMYAIPTVAGDYYTVTLSGSWLYNVPLIGSVQVVDSAGNIVGTDFNEFGSGVVRVTFVATSESTFFNVGASSAYPDDFGQYTIRVNEGSPTESIAWNRTSLSNVKVYFAGDAELTNTHGQTYFAPAWSDEEYEAALQVFQQYSDVANVTFTVVDDPAAADFFMAKMPEPQPFGGRWSVYGGTVELDGVAYDVAGMGEFVYDGPSWIGLAPGGLAYNILVHEIGHAMGLTHPFGRGVGSPIIPGTSYSYETGDFNLNQSIYTVMSYVPGFADKDGSYLHGDLSSLDRGDAGSPMALDIAVLQQMHGANMTTRTGDDAYLLPDANVVGSGYIAIWDAGGTDTIAVAATNTIGTSIDLRAASLRYDSIGGGAVSWVHGVQGGFTIANGVVIENARGAEGDDLLVGNDANNRLEGNGGADEIAGGRGDDELLGGSGNDRLFGDVLPGKPTGIGFGSGLIVNGAGANNNRFVTAQDLTGAFALGANSDIANATLTPHVTIRGTGDGSIDVFKLTLEAGAIVTFDMDHTTGGLDGWVDIFKEDLTRLANYDDSRVSEGADGSSSPFDPYGTFTASEGGTYYVRVLDGWNIIMAAGQNYELNISVSATTEAIGSGAGNDLLDGGAGVDTMTGGGGNDTYVIDSAGDLAIEIAAGGTADHVKSSVTYAAGAQHIERITLTGTAAINATGQGLDNVITGNAAANRVDGAGGNDWLDGGLGADQMIGGTGNDTFVVDNRRDEVVENAGGGTADEVRSAIEYTLGSHVENLTLIGTAGIGGFGNGRDNIITGNAGANRLDAGGGDDTLDGGLGADRMVGGTGDDIFIVDNSGDRVVELWGGGSRDEVRSSVSFDLFLEQVETLTLTGTASINGFGNWLDNSITGNAGANQLRGGLGDDRLDGLGGNDILNGGLGRDNFVFTTALGSGNLDVIQDFSHASDSITLDNAIFVGLSNGALSASAFKDIGHGAAVASNDRIIYNSSNGDLFFDQDGSGTGFTALKFAELADHTQLRANDLFIV